MTNSIWQSTIQKENGDIVASPQIEVIDEKSGLPATIFSDRAGTALTNPFFGTSDGLAQFYTTAGEYRITATNTATSESQTWRNVRIGDGGSRDVQTSPTDTTAGALMAVGAGGWLANINTPNFDNGFGGDLNSYTTSGAWALLGSSTTANAPESFAGSNGVGVLKVWMRSGNDDIEQEFTGLRDISNGLFNLSYRRTSYNGVWQAWQPVYTGANLNPNEFKGNTAEFLSSTGFGRTATTANIYFSLSSNSNPASITVTGSFTVDTPSFTSRGTVTSSNITLQVISTGKLGRIDISGLSGVVSDEPLLLRSASANSSIIFNF